MKQYTRTITMTLISLFVLAGVVSPVLAAPAPKTNSRAVGVTAKNASQKDALKAARQQLKEALKATKTKKDRVTAREIYQQTIKDIKVKTKKS